MPGMPYGKPAGVRCLHLNEDRLCTLYESPERPDICRRFTPELAFCGTNFNDAIEKISVLELATRPID